MSPEIFFANDPHRDKDIQPTLKLLNEVLLKKREMMDFHRNVEQGFFEVVVMTPITSRIYSYDLEMICREFRKHGWNEASAQIYKRIYKRGLGLKMTLKYYPRSK